MLDYLARRAALSIVTLWALTLLAFILLRVAPGDAALGALAQSAGEGFITPEQLETRRHELGLDRSWTVQYIDWLSDLVRLDPGRSLASGEPVSAELGARFAVTIELGLLAALLAAGLGVPGGVIAASRRGGALDAVTRAGALTLLATPAFWAGLLLILVLTAWFGYFAPPDYAAPWQDPVRNLQQIAPAAIILALGPAAVLLRVTRTATIDALNRDYVRTARAKGLPGRTILWRHAFRNAAPQAITLFGVQAVYLLGGSVIIEQLFNLPGMGRALASAAFARDYPTVLFLVLIFGATALATNLLIDAAHVRLDPRIGLDGQRTGGRT